MTMRVVKMGKERFGLVRKEDGYCVDVGGTDVNQAVMSALTYHREPVDTRNLHQFFKYGLSRKVYDAAFGFGICDI